jgi:hypothetical protein
MGSFNYKKWVAKNKHGKNNFNYINEQDFWDASEPLGSDDFVGNYYYCSSCTGETPTTFDWWEFPYGCTPAISVPILSSSIKWDSISNTSQWNPVPGMEALGEFNGDLMYLNNNEQVDPVGSMLYHEAMFNGINDFEQQYCVSGSAPTGGEEPETTDTDDTDTGATEGACKKVTLCPACPSNNNYNPERSYEIGGNVASACGSWSDVECMTVDGAEPELGQFVLIGSAEQVWMVFDVEEATSNEVTDKQSTGCPELDPSDTGGQPGPQGAPSPTTSGQPSKGGGDKLPQGKKTPIDWDRLWKEFKRSLGPGTPS